MLAMLYLGSLAIRWTSPLFAPSSIATVQLTLNCFELAAAGFVAGRLHRPSPMIALALFALSIAFVDFGELMPLNVFWLIRLTRDLWSDSRFFDSWLTTVGTHLLLFGSLIAGGMLSRPRRAPVSIAFRDDL